MSNCPISFEFFPPKTPKGMEKLKQTAKVLNSLNPVYYSVTFGAGGSTRTKTFETVKMLHQDLKLDTAPHLSCINAHKHELIHLIQAYAHLGVQRIVALRGDMPEEGKNDGGFKHAVELVALVRELLPDINIEVACYPEPHPEAPSFEVDFQYFLRKVEAGATAAITQYFYNPDAYYYFLERLEKAQCHIPVIPGVMPITEFDKLVRFSKMCGAELPKWLRSRLLDFEDKPDALKAFGLDVVSRLCDNLIEQGAPGLHFYTLNDPTASYEICERLKLKSDDTQYLSSQSA